MTIDLEDRLRTTFDVMMPLLYVEPAEDVADFVPPTLDVSVGADASRQVRARPVLVATCAAIVIATVAVIAIVGRHEPVAPVDTSPSPAPTLPLGAPDWYTALRPFLPAGFDHIAVNDLSLGTRLYTAINVASGESLDITLEYGATATQSGVVGTDPRGDLQQTLHGYQLWTPAEIGVSLDCSIGNPGNEWGDTTDYCADVDDAARRAMAYAIGAAYPFDSIKQVEPRNFFVDLDSVRSLMVAALPDQRWLEEGDGTVFFGRLYSGVGDATAFTLGNPLAASSGTSVSIVRNVFPADDGGDVPVMHTHGSSSVGWIISGGVATRVLSSRTGGDRQAELTKLLSDVENLATDAANSQTAPETTATTASSTTESATTEATPTTAVPTTAVPAVATTLPLTADPVARLTYLIQAGDYLSAIARDFCVAVDELVAENHWDGPNHVLIPGDHISIPPDSCVRGMRFPGDPVDPAMQTVLVAGDASADGVAQGLDAFGVKTSDQFHTSTGLIRSDFFDWPRAMEGLVAGLPAGAPVVFSIGVNDGQAMLSGPVVGSAAWNVEYGERVQAIVSTVVGAGHPLIWVAPPDSANPQLNAALISVREATETALTNLQGVFYVDSSQVLAGAAIGPPLDASSQRQINLRVALALRADGFAPS